MTDKNRQEIEEKIMQYSKELIAIRDTHNVGWLLYECEKASKSLANELSELLTTPSTDVEKIKEVFVEKFGNTIANGNSIGKRTFNGDCVAYWDFFLPHLQPQSVGEDVIDEVLDILELVTGEWGDSDYFSFSKKYPKKGITLTQAKERISGLKTKPTKESDLGGKHE